MLVAQMKYESQRSDQHVGIPTVSKPHWSSAIIPSEAQVTKSARNLR